MSAWKPRARVFVKGWDLYGTDTLEAGTIVGAEPMTRYSDGSDYPGWFLVKFDDGARLVVHESRMTTGNYGSAP